MRKNLFMLTVLLLAVLLAGPAFAQGPQPKDWTLMLYFVPDAKIESGFLNDDVASISRAGAKANMNVVLFYDYAEKGKPSGFFILEKNNFKPVKNLGETNMGSAQNLYDFMKFSMTNYPSSKYALVINAHGSGWESYYGPGSSSNPLDASQIPISPIFQRNGLLDGGAQNNSKSIAYDDDPQDCLTLQEISKAVGEASRNFNGGKKLDLFVTYACLFSMLEAAYELKDVIGILVSSESTVPCGGFDYPSFIAAMAAPSSTAVDAAKTAVSRFVSGNYGDNILAGIDLSKVEPVAIAFSDLAQRLMKVSGAVEFKTATRMGKGDKYSDILSLLDGIAAKNVSFKGDSKFAEIEAQAAAVSVALKASLVAWSASGKFKGGSVGRTNAGGLAIYWPDAERYKTYRKAYKTLQFGRKFFWDEFLDWQLLKIPAAAAAETRGTAAAYGVESIISELDGAFARYRRGPEAGSRIVPQHEMAKVEFLKKRLVDETMSQHRSHRFGAVRNALESIKSAPAIDTATKNKILLELNNAINTPVK